MTVFRSMDDAIAMGFVLAINKTYLTHRGCILFGFDTSGPGIKGASYGIRVEVPEDYTKTYLGARSKPFGQSIDVSIGGSLGSFAGGARRAQGGRIVQMFTPQEFERALHEAKEWTDSWFRAHPDAISLFNERQRKEKELERAAARAAT